MLIARNSPIFDFADTVRSNHVRIEQRFNSWYRLSVKLGMIWDMFYASFFFFSWSRFKCCLEILLTDGLFCLVWISVFLYPLNVVII